MYNHTRDMNMADCEMGNGLTAGCDIGQRVGLVINTLEPAYKFHVLSFQDQSSKDSEGAGMTATPILLSDNSSGVGEAEAADAKHNACLPYGKGNSNDARSNDGIDIVARCL